MSVDRKELLKHPKFYKNSEMNALASRMNKELGDKALIMGMEECSELIKAVSKFMRFSDKTDNNYKYKFDVTEEIADVIIAINIFKDRMNIRDEDIKQMIDYKIKKDIDKLNNGKL